MCVCYCVKHEWGRTGPGSLKKLLAEWTSDSDMTDTKAASHVSEEECEGDRKGVAQHASSSTHQISGVS